MIYKILPKKWLTWLADNIPAALQYCDRIKLAKALGRYHCTDKVVYATKLLKNFEYHHDHTIYMGPGDYSVFEVPGGSYGVTLNDLIFTPKKETKATAIGFAICTEPPTFANYYFKYAFPIEEKTYGTD